MLLIHLAPALMALGIFLATVFDVRIKAAFRALLGILFDPAIGGFVIILLATLWSLLVGAGLHLHENRTDSAWVPRVLS